MRLRLFFNLLEVAISSGSSGIEALSGSHNVYMHTGYGRTRNLLAVKTDVRLNDRCRGQESKDLREELERNVWREYAAIQTLQVWKEQAAVVLAVAMAKRRLSWVWRLWFGCGSGAFPPLVASHNIQGSATRLTTFPIIFSCSRQLSIVRDMVECVSTAAGIA